MQWRKLIAVFTPICALGILAVAYGCGTDRLPAEDTPVTLQPPNVEGPCTNGATRTCYELLSVHNGVKSCLTGTQKCEGTRWTACAGGDQTALIESKSTNGLKLAASTEGVPELEGYESHLTPLIATGPLVGCGDGGDAASCNNACSNPCDPTCLGNENDAGLRLDANTNPEVINILPGTNSGFSDKLLNGLCGQGGSVACDLWNGGPRGNDMLAACQADTYCASPLVAGGDGCCRKFGGGDTYAAADAGPSGIGCDPDGGAKPDLTINSPCTLPDGTLVIAVCNRGTGPVPAGSVISIKDVGTSTVTPSGWIPTGSCPYSGGGTDCNYTVTGGAITMNPGECRFVPSCAASGNKAYMVNSNGSIAECDFKPSSAVNSDAGQRVQLGCENNLIAYQASQAPACPLPYLPRTWTYNYTASCATGSRPQWSKLSWDSVVPLGAKIDFDIRTAPLLADGGVGAYSASVTAGAARNPGPDPAVCPMSGPSPCPKDLVTALTPAIAQNEYLELKITMIPGGGGLLPPILNLWDITYSCVPAE